MSELTLSYLENRLKQHCNGSRSVTKTLESQFLKTSSILEEVVDLSGKMLQESHSIVQMVTLQQETELDFKEIITSVSDFVRQTTELAAKVESKLVQVFDAGDNIHQIVSLENRLMSTLAPLKTMKTFFLIEASKLSKADQSAFLSLVSDIQTLYSEARNITEQEFKQFSEFGKLLEQSKINTHKNLDRFNSMVKEEYASLEAALDDLQSDMQRNRVVDVALYKCSETINQCVSDIVTAIQNEDIAGQKSLHVFEAVEDILHHIERWKQNDFTMKDPGIPAFIVTASKIQQEQIVSVINDFSLSNQKLHQMIPQITEQVKKLDSECLELREFKVLTTSADGVIQILLESLEVVWKMLNRFFAIITATEPLVAPLQKVSTEVIKDLMSITLDLRVVTVNARIKANKQGSHSGLTPLTANVGSISVETQTICNSISYHLEQLQIAATNALRAFENSKQDALGLKERFQTYKKHSNENLHAFRDNALEKILRLLKDAENVERVTAQCWEVSKQGFSQEKFYRDVIETLAELIEYVESRCGDVDLSTCHSDELEKLKARYTMDVERQNQANITGQDFQGSSSEQDSLDSIFF